MSVAGLTASSFVVSTGGVLSVQTSGLALVSAEQHTAPGVPVDLVDVSAVPLRYLLGLPAAGGDGR